MKIAVNTRILIKDKLEGVGKYTNETLRRIVKNHPEHEFYFFFDRPFDQSFVFEKNVHPVHLFPPARHPVLFVYWFEWSVARALKKYKIDFFLSPDAFLCLNTKVPSLAVVHDIAYRHFPEQVPFAARQYYRFFMKRFFDKAVRLAAVSEYTRADIVREFKIEKDKIDLTPNGCDAAFKPASEIQIQEVQDRYSEGMPFFLYTGSVHPRKNVARLIEAFSEMKKKSGAPLKLLIAGRKAWQVEVVEQALNSSEFQKDIHFLGYVPETELPKICAAAYALCYVSLFEGFGIPILEAMNCDVPVLSSNVSSMPEVCGEAAVLVDPYSVTSISEGMSKLWFDKELRNSLIEKGKAQRQLFSWDLTAEALWNSLEKAMGV